MIRRTLVSHISIVVAVAGLAGCGDSTAGVDGGAHAADSGTGSADARVVDASSTGPDAQNAVDAAPAYGLDVRPSNTTCLAGTLPQMLSQTGCFDAQDPTVPLSGLIPYDVNLPLWSDGATKRRWFALPNAATLTVDPVSGDFIVPVGGMVIKEFSRDGRRLETRFLARTQTNKWEMVSYVWAADESDAQQGSGTIPGTTWEVPSLNECKKCHTSTSRIALGLEQVQLDGNFMYPSTGRVANQVDTLIHIGVLDARTNVPPLPALDAPVSAEKRALAYLHVNCSGCHQPGEIGKYDGRWIIPFADKGLCNAVPTSGDLGDSTNRLILPGQPLHSIVRLRMASTSMGTRMPPIGTKIVHTAAVNVFDTWISGLTGCP